MCRLAGEGPFSETMQDHEYRFEGWVLHLGRRELRRGGTPVPLERRVFDLLACLVRHHDRVVSKEELLDAVWPGEAVSVGVIARAVMKARQALGDDEREGRLIRTAPRIGYRFVAPVSTHAPDEGGPAAPNAAGPSVALLPFENRTGRAEFDWVELGLLTLTVKALSGDPRLSVASVASVLLALGHTPATADDNERATVLRAALGVERVIQVSVRAETGSFALDLLILGEGSWARHRVLGNDLPALGRSAADLLEQVLLDDRARALPAAYPVADPFAARALMRGLQAAAEQRWQEAVNLFRVVLDAEPHAREIELEYLKALAPLGDDRALALGARLLAEAHAAADTARAADIHQAIGRTYLNKGLHEPAKVQLDASIRLASPDQGTESRTLALLLRSTIAVEQRDFGLAHDLLLRAQQLCEPHGSLAHRLWCRIGLAIVRARIGELEAGYRDIGLAVQLCSSHRLRRDHAATSENRARLALQLGLVDEAEACARQALRLADEVGDPYTLSFAAEDLCLLLRLAERPASEGREVLASLAEHAGNKQPGVVANTALARGHQAWAEGRLDDAIRDMAIAVTLYEQACEWLSAHDAAPWLIWACVEGGDHAAAQHWLARVGSYPGCPADPVLSATLAWLRALLTEATEPGGAALALPLVQRAADQVPPGLWSGLIGLDLVRRLRDAGQRETATHRLYAMSTWVDALPAGRRLAAELGRTTA